MHGHHALEQWRHDAVGLGHAGIVLRVFDVGALQNIFHVAEAKLVADGGHVAGDGAIAEGHEHFRPRADFVEDFQVVLVANGALDEADVHVLRDIPSRPRPGCRRVRPCRRGQSGTRRGRGMTCGSRSSRPAKQWLTFKAFHNFFSRAVTMNSSLLRSRSISASG